MTPGHELTDAPTRRVLLPILELTVGRAHELEAGGQLPILVEPGLRRVRGRLEIVEIRQIDWQTLVADLPRDLDLWDSLQAAGEALRDEEPVETAIGWGADSGLRAQALWRDVLTTLLRRYRTEAEDWRWDRNRATELLESWRAARGGEPRLRCCLAPLHNCRSMEDEVPLEEGLSIRRLEDSERDELWRNHGGEIHPGPLNPTVADLEDWHMVVDYRWTPPIGRADDVKAVELTRDVVRALRLHHPGLTGASIFWTIDDPAERWRREGAGSLFAPEAMVQRGPLGGQLESQLGPSSGEDLKVLLSALRGARGGNLPLILDRFDSAFSRRSPQDRLIDLWIALEAMILPDGRAELRYRAALRLAHLVGEGSQGKREVFELARESYDCRSRVVHGSPAPDDLGRIVEETRRLTRAALRKWLTDPPVEGVVGLDSANFGSD
jgi:hypothetical protein